MGIVTYRVQVVFVFFANTHRICQWVPSRDFCSTFTQEYLSMSAVIFINRL